ncbi:MAG: hypothetical protein ACE5KJ_00725 [Candidatus Zixiibacteriota bacterium]
MDPADGILFAVGQSPGSRQKREKTYRKEGIFGEKPEFLEAKRKEFYKTERNCL